MSGIKVVFGSWPIQSEQAFDTPEKIASVFKVLKSHGVTELDTAAGYGDSETLLGSVSAASEFTIDTKQSGGFRPGTTGEELVANAKASILEKLKTKQVDILYLHAPDASVPLEDTLAGIDQIHKAGLFKRFGLSNYKVEDVRKAYDIAKEKGYVLPSVYQGNYNPVARNQETLLFPTLRELGMAFYAYSPVAGGFLSKTRKQIENKEGRFDPETSIGKMYVDMYHKPSLLEGLDEWNAVAQEVDCTGTELACRWVSYNSPLSKERGDALIIGGRTDEQVDQMLTGLKNGPLPESAVKKIDEMWEKIKHDAPLDNYHR